MTIEQLYQWAVENGVENFEIRLEGDAGRYWYPSTDSIIIDTESHEVSV